MDKEAVKLEIKKLIEKYQRIADADKIKSYNEAQTRNEFIEPLFGFLGWDMRNTATDNEVTTEEHVSGGRVDLAFRLNNIPVMFLEAKAMKVDLDIETYSRQAINYAWNKGVAYAVLTDFESIKLYNAQAESKLLSDKLIFEISWKDYINDFDRVYLLSKDSFRSGALDEYAQKYGKMKKHLTVNEKLFGDLKEAREILMKAFRWNKELTDEELEEGVQRILDRLVFIRVLEDRKLELPILKEVLRTWEQDKSKQFFPLLIEKFRELDHYYNSNIFKEHASEKWEEYTDDAFKKVINLLYGTEVYVYDFKEIPADILGGVYESYLGYISKQKGESKKELKAAGRKKRKEQGIFYTPHYIVDFIVKETLGEKLKDIKSINELNKIKILDPACGSGSFLVRALRTMNDKYKEFNSPGDVNTKSAILTSNIYGVDLDKQAIELAKLNLLIEALDKKAKLPDITPHIREGNSLISGDAEKLEKYFGENWRDKKSFNWEENFSDVFRQDGFDVVIGNPPYIQSRNLDDEERRFYWNHYLTDTNHSDIYSFFVERSINLLKNGGVLGFIIPSTWLQTPSFKSLRKKIWNDCKVLRIAFFDEKIKIFSAAQVSNVIIILKKSSDKKSLMDNYIFVTKYTADQKFAPFSKIEQKSVDVEGGLNLFVNQEIKNILNKIFQVSLNLRLVSSIVGGLRTGDDKKFLKNKSDNKDDRKLLRGRNVSRYSLKWTGEYVWYKPDLMKVKQAAAPKEAKFFEAPEKLLVRMISGNEIIATYDDQGFYFLQDNLILSAGQYNIKYLLAILNSKLSKFIVKNSTSNIAITQSFLNTFPIRKINFDNKKDKERYNGLISLVGDIIERGRDLENIAEHSDKWQATKSEIEKLDHEIDQEVYKLYGLTAEETKIIEQV